MRKFISCAIVVICYVSFPTILLSQKKVIHEFRLSGDGKYDYLTSGKDNKLYVSHGEQVQIMDKNSGKELAVISGQSGVHGIALDYNAGKGFISNGSKNCISVFDIKTNIILSTIATDQNPDAIIFEPFSRSILVGNGKSKTLSIVDPISEKVVDNIDLGGKPEAIVSDQKGYAFINIEDKNEIVVVNLKNNKIERKISLMPDGESPTGLAIDTKRKFLFVGCKNKKLLVIDYIHSQIINTFPIGERCDGVAFDDKKNIIYTSNGEGTLTYISASKNKNPKQWIVANLPTIPNAKTIAIDKKSGEIFLSAAEMGNLKDTAGKPLPKAGTFKVLVVN